MSLHIVTVASFQNQLEAENARTLLERKGIPCALAEDNTVAWFPHLAGPIGGVKLHVREADCANARRFLEQAGLVETSEHDSVVAQPPAKSGGQQEQEAVLHRQALTAAPFGVAAVPMMWWLTMCTSRKHRSSLLRA